MGKYGIPYQGSKSLIADDIINVLPKAKRFVDLFGGGGSMSHCAVLSGRYEEVLYNEINTLLLDLFRKTINGDYNYEKFIPKFITREDFFKLKDTDGYTKYIWSFGNNGKAYLFGKNIECFKKQAHNFVLFNDKEGLDFLENHYKDSYWWFIKEIYNVDKYVSRLNYVNIILKIESIRVTRPYSDKVYNEFKDLNFAEFRSMSNKSIVDAINKYIPSIEKKDYKSNRQYEKLIELKQLQQLQQLQRLEQLQQLQQLERLQQLEQLQRLQRLEITNSCYLNYEYKQGDLVYCDPPYENTAKYGDSDFKHQQFYEWAKKANFPVYFSSYDISDNEFQIIWQKQKRGTFSQKNTDGKIEKLYWNGK